MYSEGSKIASELAELYEFSLNIGTSLVAAKNANSFFSSFAPRKNIKHISVWQKKGESVELKELFPKLQSTESPGDTSAICKKCSTLAEDQIHQIDAEYFCIANLNAPFVWIYYYEDILLVFVQNETADEFTKREKAQFVTLFRKFSISMKACFAHQASLDEVLKRQLAEYKLFERESLFRFGANSLTEGIVVTNLKNKITYVNKAMSSITGYHKDEMMGAIAYKLFQPIGFDSKAREAVYNKVIQGKSGTYKIEQIKKDKTKYWVRLEVSAFKDSSGKVIGAIASMLDITKTFNFQREIAASQKELKDLIDNMYDALLVVSETGQIKTINKAAEDLLGYSLNEAKNLDLSKIVHPDDKEKSLKYLKKLETDGYYSGYEGRIISSDGSIKEVEVNSTAIIEDGVLKGSRDIVRDVSERKELERQRKLSETKLKLIIDTALDAVVVINSEGNITDWNKNAEQIFGFTHKEVLGKSLSQFIIPEQYREAHDRGMKHYFASGEGPVLNKRIEITAIDKTHREFPIELAISPSTQDGVTFFSAFIRDITNRKEIESQKENLLEELEGVNQDLKDFAHIVSHDLKAPLRSVGSLSDWLIQDYNDVLDEEGQNLLRLLKTRIVKMHALIEGVLEYSKVGALKGEHETIDTNTLLSETIELLDPPSHVQITVDKDLPIVSYNRVRLQQVFQNFISNSIKFIDKPKGLIEVLYEEKEHLHQFSIKDNGPGIEEAYFQKIFQIFQKLDANKDDYDSTGIGLSIIKRIVELNGGNISVESQVGIGSTFSFTIPKEAVG